MRTVYRGGSVWLDGALRKADLSVVGGLVEQVGAIPAIPGDKVVSVSGFLLFPGFADVHVHLREPGFSYKETIAAGTAAAARGGYSCVCAMPNLAPVPDSLDTLAVELALLDAGACVDARAYGAITEGRRGEKLADMAGMAPYVVGFSDDGTGVNDERILLQAMREAKRLHKVIAAHSEDMSLIPKGGCVHAGAFAAANGLTGIPSESEWRPIERDLRLARQAGCAWHVCHISTKESVALIRKAKADGVDVTCETAPHYLLLDEGDLQDDGRFKMNPPIRAREDRLALLEGLADGTIDIIATDHAPHAAAEKALGLRGSAMGIVGLETAFPLLYTELIQKNTVPAARVIDALTVAPRRRFGLPGGSLVPGASADFTAYDPASEGLIEPAQFLSLGRSTPFAGFRTQGRIALTIYKGNCAYAEQMEDNT